MPRNAKDMLRIRLTEKTPLLHVETPLGIVNIRVGLTDANGRRVDHVEILPNRFVGDPFVSLDGSCNSRLIEMDPAFPIGEVVIVPKDCTNPYTYRGEGYTGERRAQLLRDYRDDVGSTRHEWALWHTPGGGGARRIFENEVNWEGSGL